MPQVHRMFFHYSEFPFSLRWLFTAALVTLGLGYVFATLQVYFVHAGLDGKPGLDAADIAIAYSGNSDGSTIQTALLGPMSGKLPHDERAAIIAWVRGGADQAQYEAKIKPIIENRCLACHDGSNPHIPNLDGYENITKVTKVYTGMSLGHPGARLAHPSIWPDVHLLHHRMDL